MDNKITIEIDNQFSLKKPHPCGGNIFTVVRVGADIKIKCNTCSHLIMVSREKFLKQIKEKL